MGGEERVEKALCRRKELAFERPSLSKKTREGPHSVTGWRRAYPPLHWG